MKSRFIVPVMVMAASALLGGCAGVDESASADSAPALEEQGICIPRVGRPCPPPYAYFEFAVAPYEDEKLIIELHDAALIQHARDILAGVEVWEPHVQGITVATTAAYNPRWGYHLDPESIQFFHAAIEVCDGHISAPPGTDGRRFCPWGSYLTRECDPATVGQGEELCRDITPR